jgi:hypothetical protein
MNKKKKSIIIIIIIIIRNSRPATGGTRYGRRPSLFFCSYISTISTAFVMQYSFSNYFHFILLPAALGYRLGKFGSILEHD